jgi:hypothetical protein
VGPERREAEKCQKVKMKSHNKHDHVSIVEGSTPQVRILSFASCRSPRNHRSRKQEKERGRSNNWDVPKPAELKRTFQPCNKPPEHEGQRNEIIRDRYIRDIQNNFVNEKRRFPSTNTDQEGEPVLSCIAVYKVKKMDKKKQSKGCRNQYAGEVCS